MTVKLALLKSGEEVISDMKEMTVPDPSGGQEKVIGYYFQYPCRVKLWGNDASGTDNATALPIKMRLLPWMPLSKDDSVIIPGPLSHGISLFALGEGAQLAMFHVEHFAIHRL